MASGRSIPLSLPRRFIGDLVHFAHQMPTVPVQKIINVASLERLRAQIDPRPSWCAIFTKAYAQVAAEFPELRRAYMSFPWARLYEHYESIASVAVERMYEGENGVFFAHIRSPEKRLLMTLESALRGYKEAPIERIVDFQIELRISKLPTPIRRIAWWYATCASGHRKAIAMGTFGISVYSSLGAESLHPLTPLTTALNYGVIQENGDLAVRVIYDHRVMDGATVARALARLEHVLNHQIAAELRDLASVTPLAGDPAPLANALAPLANDATPVVTSVR
jgi:pyruvate/2-oxoglutarate dehydrogenase complex dihydrolipoamide acyltransferase (E2) component